ncbi:MAG: response regulator [Candidatus Acidiferrales bacterium]
MVDDFVPWRSYIVAKLAENPALHIVGFAADGLEAVQKAAELRPDLILMDINLPNLSGISAARRIRELSLETKILFVSQNVDVDVVRTALDAGGFGYVVKSSAESELLAAVEAVMLGRIFVSDQLASRDVKHVLGAQASIQSVFEESIESAAPPVPVDNAFGHSHEVEFYRNDASFLNRCTRFMGTALGNGDSVILVATLSHGNSLRARLEAEGYNIAEATERGRYLAVEPAYLLSEFLANGQPDSARYMRTAANLIETALKAATGKRPRVAACGESTALLYAEGRAEAAVEMERLSQELILLYDVDILCGYPMVAFRTEEERSIFRRICAEHSAVYSR